MLFDPLSCPFLHCLYSRKTRNVDLILASATDSVPSLRRIYYVLCCSASSSVKCRHLWSFPCTSVKQQKIQRQKIFSILVFNLNLRNTPELQLQCCIVTRVLINSEKSREQWVQPVLVHGKHEPSPELSVAGVFIVPLTAFRNFFHSHRPQVL